MRPECQKPRRRRRESWGRTEGEPHPGQGPMFRRGGLSVLFVLFHTGGMCPPLSRSPMNSC